MSAHAVLRRAWIPIVATLLVAGFAGLLGSVTSSTSISEAVVIVPSGANADGPGAAGEATKLALTYAGTIAYDAGVLEAVSRRLASTPDKVTKLIRVSNPPETAVLRISFEATNTRSSLAGARAVVTALIGPAPEAQSVEPDSLRLVRAPITVAEAGQSGRAIPVGIVLGLCLGLVLALAWERADPRIDDPRQLAAALGCPATSLGDLTPDAAAALIERWRIVSHDSRSVPLVAATPDLEGSMLLVAARLSEAAVEARTNVRVSLPDEPEDEARYGTNSRVDDRDETVLVVGGVPGGSGAAERAAGLGDPLVMVAHRGARRAEVLASAQLISQLTGKMPGWALLVGKLSPGSSRAAQRVPRADRVRQNA